MSLMEEINRKAFDLTVPLSVQLDLTWRCNENCVHCYLDHEGRGELSTAEIKDILRQLSAAGVFFLAISGGEPLLRSDCFEIMEYARSLQFNVKLKTNAVLIGPEQAERLRKLNIEQIQISIYSHRDEIHDAITKLPGSLQRSLNAIRLLKSQQLKVSITTVLMKPNRNDGQDVRRLADELGVGFNVDPTITPKMNGDRAILDLGITFQELQNCFNTPEFVGDVGEFCAPPLPVDGAVLDGSPCSAGHSACYISPRGDVFPCVQFPLSCGNLRETAFAEIWKNSEALKEVRSIRVRDLPSCSICLHAGSCTRCPGLAFMEGDMRGVSSADCEKSRARTLSIVHRDCRDPKSE
jgi:radical SAM protein with 4Fe4S-binding SPASM domain